MKRKRGEHPIYGWVWTMLTIVLIIVGITLANERGFAWDGFALWVLILLMPSLAVACTAYHDQHEQTLEFIVYEFERWSKEDMKYETRYIVDIKTLRSMYLLNWHVKDYESYMTFEQLEKYIYNEVVVNDHSLGYKSEEEAMQYITDFVQRIITNKRERENVKIKNIKMSGTHALDDVITKINNGELKPTPPKK